MQDNMKVTTKLGQKLRLYIKAKESTLMSPWETKGCDLWEESVHLMRDTCANPKGLFLHIEVIWQATLEITLWKLESGLNHYRTWSLF